MPGADGNVFGSSNYSNKRLNKKAEEKFEYFLYTDVEVEEQEVLDDGNVGNDGQDFNHPLFLSWNSNASKWNFIMLSSLKKFIASNSQNTTPFYEI